MNRLPLYQLYELSHAAVYPARAVADAARLYFKNPVNPLSYTMFGKAMAAFFEMFERATRRYGKPEWHIDETIINGVRVSVTPQIVWERSFCKLVHFACANAPAADRPQILLVAPMSGHYATLLRGTVEALLPAHDVYITDWVDAREVPLALGSFDLDDYIDYVIDILHLLGRNTHVIGVCQPSVPVLAAVALMEADEDPSAPLSMILMGGPIDTRRNPTAVNKLAEERGIGWFRQNVISRVPLPNPGFMREVYPGFLQITGFMTMNLDRHVDAHQELFRHLVRGDGDSADKHTEFYDEYLAVMDLTAEFYLQTVDSVFVKQSLPKGKLMHRGAKVEPSKIRNVALMTVEGEYDDISGVGQTQATHDLCTNIPSSFKLHHLQKGVGHYGVFNGSRFRSEIVPKITEFIRKHHERGEKEINPLPRLLARRLAKV